MNLGCITSVHHPAAQSRISLVSWNIASPKCIDEVRDLPFLQQGQSCNMRRYDNLLILVDICWAMDLSWSFHEFWLDRRKRNGLPWIGRLLDKGLCWVSWELDLNSAMRVFVLINRDTSSHTDLDCITDFLDLWAGEDPIGDWCWSWSIFPVKRLISKYQYDREVMRRVQDALDCIA